MASKISTGLVGIAVEANARHKLKLLYENLVTVVSRMPSNTSYRTYTEEFANQQLYKLDTIKDDAELESAFGTGQLEEVLLQAKSELHLARKLETWKPWEGSATQPPTGQWDWP